MRQWKNGGLDGDSEKKQLQEARAEPGLGKSCMLRAGREDEKDQGTRSVSAVFRLFTLGLI